MPGPIVTPITKLFGIEHPIILAGMSVAAGPALAAAVTNAGGLGVVGGLHYTPRTLRQLLEDLKKNLQDKDAPFGVDLLLPQIGGSRKTNYDYTKGQLAELINVIIEEKAALFVSAVGIPPKEVVEQLHRAGIPVMNMVGHPKHVARALAVGVDLICVQGGEGGGHTGNIPASILVPACVDAVKGHTSPLNGSPIYVVAAGGIHDGRGLAANLMYGAQAVWVGTRFVASEEAGAPQVHKDLIISATHEDIVRTRIYTGRTVRVFKTPYVDEWEKNRQEEIQELTSRGIIPNDYELERHPQKSLEARAFAMGSVGAVIHDVLPAKIIVDNMVRDAVRQIRLASGLLSQGFKPKL